MGTATSTVVCVNHAVPADQPHSVHQIAARLFPAYQVEKGSVRLAGCMLDDRLFVRLEYGLPHQRRLAYVDPAGEELSAAAIADLGLATLVLVARPPRRCEPELQRAIAAGRSALAARLGLADLPEPLTATAVWCKFAEGKLRFSLGEQTADLAFCGWARTLQPPPFVCPHTGVKTFRLAATDDGRIAAAEQIGVCGETGRRVLAAELVTCATTGKRVLAELAAVCPITGQRSLVTALSECTTCRQQVSPGALERGECAACRGLQATSKDDPRIVRLLAEFPALERWGSWRIAETASVFVLTAARWLRRVLLVADRQSLELKLVATGSRLFSGWDAVDPQQHELVLRD